MWLIYEILLFIGLLCYVPKALWRRRLPHRGWAMRLGRYPDALAARLKGRQPIWIHAVSVGEVMAIQPLIWEVVAHQPDQPVVLSTVTSTGFAVASRLIGTHGVVIYGPLDFRRCVGRALETIRPRLLLLVESELWPTLIHMVRRRQIPVAVVNGRVSERAYRRCRWARPWFKPMLESVDLLLMQSDTDAKRVIALGAPQSRVEVLGSLKWDASLVTRPKRGACEELARQLGLQGDDAVIVAGSTHRGEERVVLQAFQAIRNHRTSTKLIIAPRHLERLKEVEALARRCGVVVARTSILLSTPQPWDVAVVDTLGQLPVFYGIATMVFIGGSLVPHGGQNPLEAASLGKPVIVGPSMHNFTDIVQQLLRHQAAYQLRHRGELLEVIDDLLSHREKALAVGQRAQDAVERLSGTAQQTYTALTVFLTARPSSS